MLHLTKQEQRVLTCVLLMLLTGLAVKVWRTSHPPATKVEIPPAPKTTHSF